MAHGLCRAAAVAALLLVSAVAFAQGKLELVPPGAPALVVIPTDTPTAVGAITLRNSGNAAVTPALTASTFFTDPGNEPLTITAKFTAAAAIEPGKTATIPVELAGVTEPGYAKGELHHDGVKLGELRVLRKAFAFNVAPVGFDAKQPFVVRRVGGKPSTIRLLNSDPFTHALEWSVIGEDGDAIARGNVPLLRPNSIHDISIPARRMSGPLEWLEGTLQSPRNAATLLLRAVPRGKAQPGEYWMSKELPLQLQHTAGSRIWRELLQTFIILLLLLLGGLTSLYLTYWVPNTLKRMDVKAHIEALTSKIHELRSTPPTLRVGLSVQRNRLREKLKTRHVISIDFLPLVAEIEREAASLHRRVAAAQRIEFLLLGVEREWKSGTALGPTILRQASVLLQKGVDELERGDLTDDDLRSVEAFITQARQLLQTTTEDKQLTEALVARAVVLQQSKNVLQPVAAAVSALAPALTVTSSAGLVWPSGIWKLDYAVSKMEIAAGVPTPDQQPQLLSFLRLHSLHAFEDAEGEARQIREQVAPALLSAALTNKEARIDFHPERPRVNALVAFELKLVDPKLDAAAAKDTFTCRWDFGDGLHEDGWRVSHYFAKPGKFSVSAIVTDRAGAKIPISPVDVNVQEDRREIFGSRTRIEWIRLGVALFVVLLGLIAGAKEQLAKLDFVAAIMALFLLGVTADQIKNLLAPRP